MRQANNRVGICTGVKGHKTSASRFALGLNPSCGNECWRGAQRRLSIAHASTPGGEVENLLIAPHMLRSFLTLAVGARQWHQHIPTSAHHGSKATAETHEPCASPHATVSRSATLYRATRSSSPPAAKYLPSGDQAQLSSPP